MMFRTFIIFIVLLVPLVSRADDRPAAKATAELGVLSGYGITHRYFGATRTQVQTWDAIIRFGYFLSDDVGQGSWYQGRHQLLLELPYHLAVDHDNRSMTGGYVLGSWKFTGYGRLLPYLLAGGGILYVDLGLPTMGTRLDYSYQGGIGMQYLLDSKTALLLEYRYHHISNAGTATPNEPLNSSKILLGVTVYLP